MRRAAYILAGLYLAIGSTIGTLWAVATNVTYWWCVFMVVGWAPWLIAPDAVGGALLAAGLGNIFFFTR